MKPLFDRMNNVDVKTINSSNAGIEREQKSKSSWIEFENERSHIQVTPDVLVLLLMN